MFRLSSEPIDCDVLRAATEDVRAGAFVAFEGRVRESNEGKQVTLLEYEAYGALAEKEGARIVAEARERFQIIDAACVHRTGALKLGEVAVWVGVTAKHRGAAFEAARYIIDEVKSRVPVWKKEHYVGGATEWVNCAHAHEHSHAGVNAHPEMPTDWRIDPLDMSRAEFKAYELIDIREPDEDPTGLLSTLLFRDIRNVPLSSINIDSPGLDASKQYMFIDGSGVGSDVLVAQLRSRGFANTYSLAGGLQALRRKFIA